MAGKTIVITGGTLGIGEAAARKLREMGANVAITGRSNSSVALARELGCDFFRADYANLADVQELADALLAKYPRIDVLANNVGGIMNERTVTIDGHEKTFQINHLAGFLLTELLRERLIASQAIVINTASYAHTMGRIDLEDLENSHGYAAFKAYGTAKLMNILHARELGRRYPQIRAVSFHPGVVATGFARSGSARIRLLYNNPFKNLFMVSPAQGADTLVWLASAVPGRDWIPGEYYHKRKLGKCNVQAKDLALAAQLWEASVALLKK